LVGLVGLMNIQCVHSAEATKKLAEGKEFCLLMGDGVGDCTMADGLEIETLKVPWLKSGIIQLQHPTVRINALCMDTYSLLCLFRAHLSRFDMTGWLLE